MITRDNIKGEYFSWLLSKVDKGCNGNLIDYTELMNFLYSKEFYWSIPMDSNRAKDGISLRDRFMQECRIPVRYIHYLEGPCSVLEMMVGLAIRCEEQIMSDPNEGDRTGIWFWVMITNLDLHTFTNDMFDAETVDIILDVFLERRYKRNGQGGLFYIENTTRNLRTVEIWYQLMWYLDEILRL